MLKLDKKSKKNEIDWKSENKCPELLSMNQSPIIREIIRQQQINEKKAP